MQQMNERDINECLLCVHFSDLVIHKIELTAVLYLQHDMLLSRDKSNSGIDCLKEVIVLVTAGSRNVSHQQI